jgi:hypothetical protein
MSRGGKTAWSEILSMTKPRAKGTLNALQIRSWRAVRAADAALTEAMQEGDVELVLKAVHALGQVAGQYAKLFEISDVDARLKALEEKIEVAKGITHAR